MQNQTPEITAEMIQQSLNNFLDQGGKITKLNPPSKRPSRKKSQPKPSVIFRARSYHKLNPEEAVSRAW